MGVRIGHASIDERGKISGGQEGDQTGKEICVRSWYKKPWNVMIVCNDKNVARQAAKYMQEICNDNRFGYDQAKRLTGYQRYGKNMKASFDCSSLVAFCYKRAGVNVNVADTTSSIRADFKNQKKSDGSDMFTIYTDDEHVNTDKYSEPGAVYLREGKHVVMALDYGSAANKTVTVTPAPQTVTSANVPTYSVGRVYTTTVDLYIRKGPGKLFAKLTHRQLSADGQRHDKDGDGALDKGTRVTCKEVRKIGNDIWIRTPSGWMAAYYQGKVYIK